MSTVSAKNRQVYYLKGKYLLGVAGAIRRYDDSSDLEQGRMLSEGDLPYVLIRRGLFFRQKVLLVPSATDKVDNLRVDNLLVACGIVAKEFVDDNPDEFGPSREFSTSSDFYVLMLNGSEGFITING